MAQTSDEVVANGKQSSVEIQSKEQAKALHAQLNRFYRQSSGGRKKNKPVIKPRGKVTLFQKEIGIEETPTDFDGIEDEPFSLTPNSVAQIWVKTGKERMKCVNTGKSVSLSGAAVYRVFL
jgi:hypothetical protein